MAILWIFWKLWYKIAKLYAIQLYIGLPINIDLNEGRNKFEGRALKIVLWPKIDQRHVGARASHGHNVAIFHPILINEYTELTKLYFLL